MFNRCEKNITAFEIPRIYDSFLNSNIYIVDLNKEDNDVYSIPISAVFPKWSMYGWKEEKSPFGGIIAMNSYKKENTYGIENERLMELLKTEQDKVYSLIKEIINYRSEVCSENKRAIIMDLYKKELISGSIVKTVLGINHYELLELIDEYEAEYKVEYDKEEKESNLEFLRGLL